MGRKNRSNKKGKEFSNLEVEEQSVDRSGGKWPLKKKCLYFMVIVGIVLGLVSMVTAIAAYKRLTAYSDEFSAIAATWEIQPISKVWWAEYKTPEEAEANCENYISSAYFEGTAPFCLCSCNVNYKYNERDDLASCTADELRGTDKNRACVDVPGLPRVKAAYFRPNLYLCYERDGPTALQRSERSGDGCRDTTERVCGGEALFGLRDKVPDHEVRTFCWPKDMACPVTDIMVGAAADYSATMVTGLKASWDDLKNKHSSFVETDDVGYEVDWSDNDHSKGWFVALKRGASLDVAQAYSKWKRPLPKDTYYLEADTFRTNGAGSGLAKTGYPLLGLSIDRMSPCVFESSPGYPVAGGKNKTATSSLHRRAMDIAFQKCSTSNLHNVEESPYANSIETSCGNQDNAEDREDFRAFHVFERRSREIFAPQVNGQTSELMRFYLGDAWENYTTTGMPTYHRLTAYQEVAWFPAEDDPNVALSSCPSREEIVDAVPGVDELRNAQTALLVLTIMSFIGVVLIGGCLTLRWIGKDDDGVIRKGEPNYKKACTLKIIKYILKLAAILCSIITIAICLGLVGVFNELSDPVFVENGCSDELSSENLGNLGHIIQSLSKEDFIIGATSSIDGVVSGVITVFSDYC